ncbi:MAG: serine/threonine-protein kinase [Chloroflexaceae bacterium]|nr:serine/threonine-protein kinase [Chloroflexaceae bacterium]
MHSIAPGTQIGRFHIEAEVGRGGMGVVYRGLDQALQRPVAIKLIAPHLSDVGSGGQRFQAEAAAVARLKHPNIAAIYETGDHEGQPYIAFEWVEGVTLAQVLESQGRLPPARALPIMRQVAAALDYAHARGIIHRDLKPSNIIIGPGDEVTVIDFGLARVASAASLTATGSLFGTPRYIAPEQIRGETLDGRTDLYSAAAMLYEMLTGRPPFTDEAIHTLMHQHLTASPPPASEANPALPPALDVVLARAMAKRPVERYPSLSAFADAVAEALGPTQHALVPAAQPPARRWPLWGAGAGLGLLVLVLVLGTAMRQGAFAVAPGSTATAAAAPVAELPTAEPTPAPTAEPTPEPTAEPTPEPPPTPVPPNADGWWPASGGNAAQTGQSNGDIQLPAAEPRWSRNQRTGQFSSMVAGGGLLVFSLNNQVARAINWENGQVVWESNLEGWNVGPPAFYADEQKALVVFPIVDRGLHAFDLSTGTSRWLTPEGSWDGANNGGITVGENGRLYAATDSGWLYAVQSDDGQIAWSRRVSEAGPFPSAPAYASGRLFLAGPEETLYALNADNGETIWTARTAGSLRVRPMLAEGLGLVLVGTEQGRVQAFSAEDGAPRWAASANGGIAGMAHDGERVYATTYGGTVYAWQASNGELLWSFSTESVISAAPVTDGNVVVISTQAGEVRFINVVDGSETGNRLTFQAPLYETPVPAGGWLFVQAGQIYGFSP